SSAEVRQALAAVLGSSAMVRAPREDLVTARLNALAAIRFRTRVTDQGTVLSYQVWMTRAGWALLAALVLSLVGSVVALAAGLVLVGRGSKFVKSVGTSLAHQLLADSMGVQLARAPPESGKANTFELLVGASEQVPDWLDAQRRAGLSGDPKMAFLILLLTSFTGSFLMNGLAQLLFGGIASAGMA